MSIFISNHDSVNDEAGYGVVNSFRPARSRTVGDHAGPGSWAILPVGRASARNLHENPQILNGLSKRTANRPGMVAAMAKIIPFRFRRSRLLLAKRWWLTPPVRSVVIALPNASAPKPKPKIRHLTLVHPGK
jgi:hypothetical protein